MKTIVILIGAAALVAVGFLVGSSVAPEDTAPAPEAAAPARGEPKFTWEYRSFEREEIPRTAVTAVATYGNGDRETREAGEVDGSCDIEPGGAEAIGVRAEVILCYYAGGGSYFMIVEESGGYAVQRRDFDEGSPDYEPPVLPFETVARF